jgi:hypothetical protein
MIQPIQKDAMDQFKGTLNQAIASVAVAKATYSALMLSPEQVQSPATSNDKGYINLDAAGPLLEIIMVQCLAAIFERAKEDQRKEASKPAIVQMNGGSLSN